jgi:hypothetical protein
MANGNLTLTSSAPPAGVPGSPLFGTLPDWCYIDVTGIYPDIAIGVARLGKPGFERCAIIGMTTEEAAILIAEMNRSLGIEDWQVRCMRAGALLGWDDLSANPHVRWMWHAPASQRDAKTETRA